jgi:hypothetical protein
MKYRILHVSHLASLSGAEQALLRLMGNMDRALFDSLVVLPSDGPLRATLDELGVETRVLPIRWWIPATHWNASEFLHQMQGLEERWQDLARLAARESVHLIHTNTVVTIEGALAAAALGIPHVWACLETDSHRPIWTIRTFSIPSSTSWAIMWCVYRNPFTARRAGISAGRPVRSFRTDSIPPTDHCLVGLSSWPNSAFPRRPA